MSAGMVILILVLLLAVVSALGGILYEQRNQAEAELAARDESVLAAVIAASGHPSTLTSLRPLAPVIDFPQRRGDVS